MLSSIARRPSAALYRKVPRRLLTVRHESSAAATVRKTDSESSPEFSPPPSTIPWLASKVSGLQQTVAKTAVKTVLRSSLGPPAPNSPAWSAAVQSGEKLVQASTAQPASGSVINPRELLGSDLTVLTETIRRLLGSGHPVLTTISNYYFHAGGKHVRPLIVLLISKATALPSSPLPTDVDTALSAATSAVDFSPASASIPAASDILATQRRLAEITEMIHTASLLHDDVIDLAKTRRAQPSANEEFGNKMAVLAGDFLLARASVALARLQNTEVVELLATVISDLVEGEFMQLRNSALATAPPATAWLHRAAGIAAVSPSDALAANLDYYMQKTYLKTASLIAKSARAAAVLGGASSETADAAYAYGRNIGLAFQLVDDLLDFTTTADEFGKPVNADLSLGLATAPVLYAAETHPELVPLIERNFGEENDVQKARSLVLDSDGLHRTQLLAELYCLRAVDSISMWPDSPAKAALANLTDAVLTRTK
ncbi:coq1 putative hexaprenyl diphosphate synthase [Geranomyces michiganensis]|nr:coq1 putative hexaprenyl diphosphate synthase [Geranomyces michiganensis]